MGAARGLTKPLGEQLSDILEPVAKGREVVWEARYKEKVLRKIFNHETRKVEERNRPPSSVSISPEDEGGTISTFHVS